MKKLILLIIPILLLCGCSSNLIASKDSKKIFIYTDSETCVEYLIFRSGYKGGLSVRYNQDGTIKLNEKCLGE